MTPKQDWSCCSRRTEGLVLHEGWRACEALSSHQGMAGLRCLETCVAGHSVKGHTHDTSMHALQKLPSSDAIDSIHY